MDWLFVNRSVKKGLEKLHVVLCSEINYFSSEWLLVMFVAVSRSIWGFVRNQLHLVEWETAVRWKFTAFFVLTRAAAARGDVCAHERPDCRAVWLCTCSRGIRMMEPFRRIQRSHVVATWISSDTSCHNGGNRMAYPFANRCPHCNSSTNHSLDTQFWMYMNCCPRWMLSHRRPPHFRRQWSKNFPSIRRTCSWCLAWM